MKNKLITIAQAKSDDAELISSILTEAADWLTAGNQRLWHDEHVSLESIRPDVHSGLYYIARSDNESAGVVRVQLEDPDFWPDAAPGEAIYLHRLAVRRKYAGGQITSAIFNWAIAHTHQLNRKYLRLDTAANRPKLRSVYERAGFQFLDLRDMGFIVVARYQYPIAS